MYHTLWMHFTSSLFTFPNLGEIGKRRRLQQGYWTQRRWGLLGRRFCLSRRLCRNTQEGVLSSLKTFKLEDSFDLKQQYFGWTVDPLQTNRVWFFNRQEAVFVNDFMGAKADNKQLILPPQCYHVDFNDEGKVTEFGFYVVDRAQGNTGGLGEL